MVHEKERDLLCNFTEYIYNKYGSDDALIIQKNVDSFLSTLPEEKEQATPLEKLAEKTNPYDLGSVKRANNKFKK